MTFDISSLCAGATSGVATDQIGSLHRQETWPCKFFKPYLTLSVPREKKVVRPLILPQKCHINVRGDVACNITKEIMECRGRERKGIYLQFVTNISSIDRTNRRNCAQNTKQEGHA